MHGESDHCTRRAIDFAIKLTNLRAFQSIYA